MSRKLWIVNTYVYCSTDNLNTEPLPTRYVALIAMALTIAGLMRSELYTLDSSFYTSSYQACEHMKLHLKHQTFSSLANVGCGQVQAPNNDSTPGPLNLKEASISIHMGIKLLRTWFRNLLDLIRTDLP